MLKNIKLEIMDILFRLTDKDNEIIKSSEIKIKFSELESMDDLMLIIAIRKVFSELKSKIDNK